jgi:hypothetical protein
MFVCPFFRMEQLGSHWMDFHDIGIGYFPEICPENASFVKLEQVYLVFTDYHKPTNALL